jgi:hypothetical protein
VKECAVDSQERKTSKSVRELFLSVSTTTDISVSPELYLQTCDKHTNGILKNRDKPAR